MKRNKYIEYGKHLDAITKKAMKSSRVIDDFIAKLSIL